MFPRSATIPLALPLVASFVTTAATTITPVSAQDLTVKALTDVSSLARSGNQVDLQTIKAGTFVSVNESQYQQVLLPHQFAVATSGSGSASLGVRAGTSPMEIVAGRGFLRGLNAVILLWGTAKGDGSVATSTSTSTSNAEPGPISFLVTFRQPSTVTGDLIVSWDAVRNAKSKWTADVDIGNDNSAELAVDSTKDSNKVVAFPVKFSGGPVNIKVTLNGVGGDGPSSFLTQFQGLRISLDRQGSCKLTSYGTPCGGARMDAGMFTIGNNNVLATNLSGGVKNGFFVRVIGSKRVDQPLPGTCRLLAEPAVVQLLKADANGGYKESFMVPANLNFTVTMQYVPFDLVGTQIQASATNAWEVVCSGF